MSNPNDGIVAAYANTLSLAGGTMTGPIAMGGNKITGVANGSAPSDVVAYGQIRAVYWVPAPTSVAATDTANVNSAISSANTAGGGEVLLSAGTYIVNGLTMLSNVTLAGVGVEQTIIQLANGANADVIQGSGFSSLTLTGGSTWGVSGISNFAIRDLTIDGNASAQTGTSYGIRVYGYNWLFRDLDVRNCHDSGIWTEWGPLSSDAPATSDGSESIAYNVKTHHHNVHGWMHLGPSDCRLIGCMAFKNNIAAGTTSIGIWGLKDQVSNILSTDSSMNGTAVSGFTGTFNVGSATPTTLYASGGTLKVVTSGTAATMTYTGKTATSFTGCTVTSGSGTFQTGSAVTTSTPKFTTNGLQLSTCHSWSNNHTWAAVFDGQTSMSDCHWEGARYGQLLIRNQANASGGMLYDFSPIASGCGLQLGDDGTTLGLPSSMPVSANACHVLTSVNAILDDTALRASVRWVAATQSNIQLHNITKTTGTYTTTVAAGSNGTDISTWTGGSPGTLTVASTGQIPDGPGVISVVTTNGTFNATYTGNNVVNGITRASGNQFTGLVAQGPPPAGSTIATGNAVTLQGIGTFASSGTIDGGSRLAVQSEGSTTAISTAASSLQEFGARTVDVGTAANAVRYRNNGLDVFNLNTSNSQLQLPNSQSIFMYSGNYSGQTLKLDGNSGVITGPSRGGAALTFPGASWVPGDMGMVSWSGDPFYVSGNSVVATAGTVYHVKIHCPVPFTATNVVLYVVTAGGTLTAGQCFAGLYHAGAGGALVATTADLSSGANSFAAAGSYSFPLAGGPYTGLPAGDYTVAFYFNGTTGPALARFGSVANNLPNMNLANGTYRCFTDSTNTGRTTSLPSTIGTQTAFASTWLAGIS